MITFKNFYLVISEFPCLLVSFFLSLPTWISFHLWSIFLQPKIPTFHIQLFYAHSSNTCAFYQSYAKCTTMYCNIFPFLFPLCVILPSFLVLIKKYTFYFFVFLSSSFTLFLSVSLCFSLSNCSLLPLFCLYVSKPLSLYPPLFLFNLILKFESSLKTFDLKHLLRKDLHKYDYKLIKSSWNCDWVILTFRI